jgi:hypothetical protein
MSSVLRIVDRKGQKRENKLFLLSKKVCEENKYSQKKYGFWSQNKSNNFNRTNDYKFLPDHYYNEKHLNIIIILIAFLKSRLLVNTTQGINK